MKDLHDVAFSMFACVLARPVFTLPAFIAKLYGFNYIAEVSPLTSIIKTNQVTPISKV